MKLLTNRYFKALILLFITNILIEIIFKLVMSINIFEWSLLRIIIGLLIVNGLFALLLSFIKKRWIYNILIIILCLISTIYSIAQMGLYSYFGTFMSFATSSQAGAVTTFISDFVQSIKPIYYLECIPLVLLIIYFIFGEKQVIIYTNNLEINFIDKIRGKNKKQQAKDEMELKKKKDLKFIRIASIGIILVLCGFYFLTLQLGFMQNKLQPTSNISLIKNPSLPNTAVREFGIIGFGLIDMKTIVFPYEEEIEIETENNNNNEQKEETNYTRKIDDTKWKEANESETKKNLIKLNNYFMNKTITDKNEYTGFFEGKNLILIMFESGSNIVLNYPEYFPNIAKLYNEGWAWDNAFSPRNACSTGNNEMSGMTSLYTINRECTANIYKNNLYPEAIFNLFNNKGYYTSSYHDYNDDYYYRHTYHPNMGSQKYYGYSELGIKLGSGYQPWPSDVEFIQKSTPHYIKENKFMSWLTTVSSHMTYLEYSVTGEQNIKLFKDEKWGKPAKRYMSKLKVVDDAIGELLKELEENKKLDNTVIMIYADHQPYGLPHENFKQIAKYNIDGNGDIDRTPFIIYNSKVTPQKFSEYTSFINIVPTIANLFNLDYDPRLYGGTDLFSSDYPNYVAFPDGSWRNADAYFDATSGKIKYLGDNTYTEEEILRINKRITNEIAMDNLAIKENYFKYLGKILKNDDETKEEKKKTTE